MNSKRPPRRLDPDQDDQYSLPVCGARTKPADGRELGPNATQLLGILRSLQEEDEG